MSRSRFRRNRGDQDAGEVEPAFQREIESPVPAQQSDVPPAAAAAAAAVITETVSSQPEAHNRTETNVSNGFADIPQRGNFHGSIQEPSASSADGHTEADTSMGFANIPRREISSAPRAAGTQPGQQSNSNNNGQPPARSSAQPPSAQVVQDTGCFWFSSPKPPQSSDGFQRPTPAANSNNNNNNNSNSNSDTQTANNAPQSENQKSDATAIIPKYLRRIEYLRSLQESTIVYPFYHTSRYLRMGYDNEPLHRFTTFSAAHPQFNLAAHSQHWTVGMIIQQIESYGENITGLVKPLVRVYAVDIETGLYTKSAARPAVRPVHTSGSVARYGGSSACWDEEVLLDADFADIASEKTVILFEIIDERPTLSTGNRGQILHEYEKIAWGYLLPVGVDGQLNVGMATTAPTTLHQPQDVQHDNSTADASHPSRVVIPSLQLPSSTSETTATIQQPVKQANNDISLRIQLYRYRSYQGLIGGLQALILTWPSANMTYSSPEEPLYPNGVPPVYLQFRLLSKRKIAGSFLRIKVGFRTRSHGSTSAESSRSADQVDDDKGRLPTSRSKKESAPTNSNNKKGRHKRPPKSKEERARLRAAALRRTRSPRDECLIPDKYLQRLESGPEGAMVVAFSNSGHLLAVASRMSGMFGTKTRHGQVFSLHLYDTDMDEIVWSEDVAHHDVIYDLKWSKNDRYLVSSSGDSSCKVWDFFSLCPLIEEYTAAYNAANGKTTQDAGRMEPETALVADGQLREDDNGITSPTPQSLSRQSPRLVQVLRLAAHVHAYSAVFQEFAAPVRPLPPLNANEDPTIMLAHLTQLISVQQSSTIPRIIVGCSDGRLRVFDENELKGLIIVRDKNGNGHQQDFSPHDGVVNSLIIDERSKYLMSADSFGDILAWRLDDQGWYQLLRKFKRDNGNNNGMGSLAEHFDSGSILSLSMHPDKLKGLMLVLSRQPAVLRTINMTTYKTLSHCTGFTGLQAHVVSENDESFSTGALHRAAFTADGKYIVCCSQDTQDRQIFRLLFWETFSGKQVNSAISKLSFPYPIRSIAWHPTQHLFAIAMVGPGAAVNIYCTDHHSVVDHSTIPLSSTVAAIARSIKDGDQRISDLDTVRRSTSSTYKNPIEPDNSSMAKAVLPKIVEDKMSVKSSLAEQSLDDRNERAERARALLAKVRSSRR